MGRSSGDQIILSYNDAVLRRSDLDILSGPYYLNDRIIEFYFSYLSSCYPFPDVLWVPPSIAFWIMNCPDAESLKDFVMPLSLPAKKLVVFPVNNNEDVDQAEGGSHWSLLAFERNANIFVHHDSSKMMNSPYAKRLYKAVIQFMGDLGSNAKYLDYNESPQQVNGYDCGLYVTAAARAICSWYKSAEHRDSRSLWFSFVKEQVTPSAVARMQSEILELIKGLMPGS